MKEGFIGGGRAVWKQIRHLYGRGRKGEVAVAFLGRGSNKRLQLSKGSTLIVNASLECIRGGQTDPNEIVKYLKRGVRVYNCPTLHAKVFLAGKFGVIGSTNVSGTSENRLEEAAIYTTSLSVISGARAYIRSMASVTALIGPEQVKQLKEEYRPPQRIIDGAVTSKRKPEFVAVALSKRPFSEEGNKAEIIGLPKATRKLSDSNLFKIEDFEFVGTRAKASLKRPIMVIQLISEGRKTYVYPPSALIHEEHYMSGGSQSGVYFLEVPRRIGPCAFSTIKRRLGKSARSLSGVKSIRKISEISFENILKEIFPIPKRN